jgi:hypothetical protein
VKHSAARAFVALPMFAVFMFASPARAEPFYAGGQRAGADVDRIVAFVNDAIAVSIERAVITNVAAWVASIPPPAPPSPPPRIEPSTRGNGAAAGGGALTQEQFARLAQCESGGVNGWRTGLYGIEAGYPIGNLSVAEQQAWVQRIYNQYGPSAWGCSAAFG